jgi:integrase
MNAEIIREEISRNGVISVKYKYRYKNQNKTHIRVCKNCKSYDEAKNYVSKLKFINENKYIIKEIASDMYLPGSIHIARLKNFGKTIAEETREQKRHVTELIIKQFGECDIRKLKVADIELFLLKDKKHSGSWKNFYLETFGSIYDETIWKCDQQIVKPKFQRFARNSKKSDILTEEELFKLFGNSKKWNSYEEYLLFLILSACGLRLGEAIGLKVDQFLFDEKMLVINGFIKRSGRTDYCKCGNQENKKYRCVPMSDKLIEKVKMYIQNKELSNNDYLFTDSNGITFAGDHLRIVLKKAMKNYNIDCTNRKLTPHSLRYTYVTRMRNVLSAEEVRKLVGHNSLEMTNYYTRVQSVEEMMESLKPTLSVINELY